MHDYRKLSDIDLEKAWQYQAQIIVSNLKTYYKSNKENFRRYAELAQQTQSEIQKEITRRN